MGRYRSFLEVFASSLNEDFHFPILEVFVFLYALGTFVFANMTGMLGQFITSGEAVAYGLVSSLTGFPLFIFVILILKNVAYGLGNDIERGVIRTFLSYPLSRRMLLTAKILSSIVIPLLLLLGIQVSALLILAPDVVMPYMNTVLLSYAAILCHPLLIAALTLIFTLLLKKGGIALITGIILYFMFGIFSGLVMFLAGALNSSLPLKVFAIINPALPLQRYYVRGMPGGVWTPTLNEVLLYVSAGYIIVALTFMFGYLYFERRLEL